MLPISFQVATVSPKECGVQVLRDAFVSSFVANLRAFLTQSDLSVENGLSRLKPKSGFLTQSKKSFFDGVFRLGDPVEKVSFSTGSASRKTQSKSFTRVFLTHFNPSHRSSHHKAHTHTPIPGTTRYHTAVSYNSADAGLAITVASRRKSAWRIPCSARQQRVSHDDSRARYRCYFTNNGYACCSFGGSRLKCNATNPLGRGFVAREARVARGERAKHRAAN